MNSFNFKCLPSNRVTLGVRSSTYKEGGGHISVHNRDLSFFLYLNLVMEQYNLQFSSVVQSCLTLCDPMKWIAARQAFLSITNSRSPPKPMSIESVMPSNHLILCHPLLFLPSIFPSIRVFSNESALSIRWPKYWSFSFNISPSNEHPGLISFRMDWLDLLTVQGTLTLTHCISFVEIQVISYGSCCSHMDYY